MHKLYSSSLENIYCVLTFREDYEIAESFIQDLDKTPLEESFIIWEPFSEKDGPDNQPESEFTRTFTNVRNNVTITIGTTQLVISDSQPCVPWETFKSIVVGFFNRLRELTAPVTIDTFGLEHINHIEFGNRLVDLNDYFALRPQWTINNKEAYDRISSFFVGVAIPFNENESLQVALTNSFSSNEQGKFLLHSDYRKFDAELSRELDFTRVLDQARDRSMEAFDKALTPTGKAYLNSEKGGV